MGKFVITKRSNGEFQFSLKSENGQTVLTSEGYITKAGCLNGIEAVKFNSQNESNYERKNSINGKYYFNLKASNGQIIGTSEMYEAITGREKGIDYVKRNGKAVTVEDTTI